MPPHAYARGHGSDQDGPVPVRPAPVPVDGKNPRAPGHHHLRHQYRHRASFRIHRLACRPAARSGSLVPQSVDGGRGNDFRRIVPHPAGAARADGPRPAPAHARLRAYRDDAGGDVPPAQYPGEDVHPRPQAHGVGAGCPLRAQRRRRGRVHQRGQARPVLRSPHCRQGRQAPCPPTVWAWWKSGATTSFPTTSTIPKRPSPRSTETGSPPATWASWTPRATCASLAVPRKSSSCAGRTITPPTSSTSPCPAWKRRSGSWWRAACTIPGKAARSS